MTDIEQEIQLDEATEQMIAALDGRSSFYDLLAAIYFRPLTIEQIDNIDAMDLSVYADINEDFASGVNDVRRYLNKRNTGTRQEMAVDFTASFGGTSSWKGHYAVPYESVFTSEEGLMYQGSYHEVYHLFKKNGVARAEGFDYPDDHLSFMFEFLNILSQRTADSLREGNTEEAVEQLTISRDFINDHILSWYGQLQELALLLIKTRFYRGIMKITKGFLLFDLEVINDMINLLTGVEPEEEEAEEAAEAAEAAEPEAAPAE